MEHRRAGVNLVAAAKDLDEPPSLADIEVEIAEAGCQVTRRANERLAHPLVRALTGAPDA